MIDNVDQVVASCDRTYHLFQTRAIGVNDTVHIAFAKMTKLGPAMLHNSFADRARSKAYSAPTDFLV